MSNFKKTLSQYWERIQGSLFSWLEEELGLLTKQQQKLITALELIRVEEFVFASSWKGRPPKSRKSIVRAFLAKSIYNLNTTRDLINYLTGDLSLRRICGFETIREIPSESTFSRAFDEFSKTKLPQRVHEALIKEVCKDNIIQHISNDSTAITAREKPETKQLGTKHRTQKKKRGRPKKEEIREPKKPSRLDQQLSMRLDEILEDLPLPCNIGCKKNSHGYIEKWTGYKLHIAAADGGIPIGAILTSASMHDSQAAIPLMALTSQRAINLYDLFDAAYYDKRIENYSKALNHVPIIDINPRRDTKLKKELEQEAKARKILHWKTPKEKRYNERTTVERVNARLKDEFGGRNTRVKGNVKVMCHLMFGLLALTADQLMRMLS